jgi:hypothetical protein
MKKIIVAMTKTMVSISTKKRKTSLTRYNQELSEFPGKFETVKSKFMASIFD